MADVVIWQNPSDSSDKIVYNGDLPGAQFYRFTLNTGFELTITRYDAPINETLLAISGGSYNGKVRLANNGEVSSQKDLTVKAPEDLVLKFDTGNTGNLLKVLGPGDVERMVVGSAGSIIRDRLTITVPDGGSTDALILAGFTTSFLLAYDRAGVQTNLMVFHESGRIETYVPFKPSVLVLPVVGADPTTAPSGGSGTVVFNTTNNKLWVYNFSAWKSVQLA